MLWAHYDCCNPDLTVSANSSCDGVLDLDVSQENHRYRHQPVSASAAPKSSGRVSKIKALKHEGKKEAANSWKVVCMAGSFIEDSCNMGNSKAQLSTVA